MNLKRIIREEIEDDWGWAKEINPSIVLEPNTLYYFEPALTPDEVENFAYNITNSDSIREWLLSRVPELMRRYGNGNEGIKYFVTGRDVDNKVVGWCTETPIGMARLSYYNSSGFVNARKEFNL
jgi:hypothetical protein